ncbi:MAG: DUF4250 domain-containing protein [Paludibacteraceae bacterium]|nr:DUF4250 domain-containing protein [Paludibacteraceae bacterium]
MDHLPQDTHMLVSAVNMLLRDGEFGTLEEVCAYFDRDLDGLKAELASAGYRYDEAQRRICSQDCLQ